MLKISIIIPTYNHLKDCLVPCLESIIRYTNLENVEIIVVANGCSEDTRGYLKDLIKQGIPIKILWYISALGYTGAINAGLEAAEGEYIILLNNDVVLLEQTKDEWIRLLYAPFIKDPLVGITGPLQIISEAVHQPFLVFFCVMIKRDVMEKISVPDVIFSPGGGEDTDFCLRAEKAGFKVVPTHDSFPNEVNSKEMVGGFPIYHKGEVTVVENPKWKEIFEANMKILRQRKDEGYYGA